MITELFSLWWLFNSRTALPLLNIAASRWVAASMIREDDSRYGSCSCWWDAFRHNIPGCTLLMGCIPMPPRSVPGANYSEGCLRLGKPHLCLTSKTLFLYPWFISGSMSHFDWASEAGLFTILIILADRISSVATKKGLELERECDDLPACFLLTRTLLFV